MAQDRLTVFQDHGKLGNANILKLIERVNIRPGSLFLKLDHDAVADMLKLSPEQINPDQLANEICFRMRRGGVELKLHLGAAPTEIDQTLIENVVKARRWLAMIIDGKTFPEIAETENTSKRRIQDVVDLALLSPNAMRAITTGEQPEGLTTDYLIKTGFPVIWDVQREKFATL